MKDLESPKVYRRYTVRILFNWYNLCFPLDINKWDKWTGVFENHTMKSVEKHMRKHFKEKCYRRYTFGLFGDNSAVGQHIKWEFIKIIRI